MLGWAARVGRVARVGVFPSVVRMISAGAARGGRRSWLRDAEPLALNREPTAALPLDGPAGRRALPALRGGGCIRRAPVPAPRGHRGAGGGHRRGGPRGTLRAPRPRGTPSRAAGSRGARRALGVHLRRRLPGQHGAGAASRVTHPPPRPPRLVRGARRAARGPGAPLPAGPALSALRAGTSPAGLIPFRRSRERDPAGAHVRPAEADLSTWRGGVCPLPS